MKNRLLLILSILAFSLQSFSQEEIHITGKLDAPAKARTDSSGAHRMLLTNETELLDSCLLKDGVFTLRGTIKTIPEYVVLSAQNKRGQFIDQWSAYVLGGQLHFLGKDLKSSKQSGSAELMKFINEHKDFAQQVKYLRDSLQAIDVLFFDKLTDAQRADSVFMSKLNVRYDLEKLKIISQRYRESKKYVLEKPDSYASFVGLMESAQMFFIPTFIESVPGGAAELKALYGKLSPRVQKRFANAQILKQLNGYSMTEPGNQIQPFTQPGLDGKTVSSEALRGKVFLIDFWGSWCGACRLGHPHLIALYSKYKDRGFEIISIAQEFGSQAKQEAAWKNAAAEDKLPWLNILNNAGGVDFVTRFGIYAFPTKFLVDRDGKIIMRLSVDNQGMLDQKLEELFPEEENDEQKYLIAQELANKGEFEKASEVMLKIKDPGAHGMFNSIAWTALQKKDTSGAALELSKRALDLFADTLKANMADSNYLYTQAMYAHAYAGLLSLRGRFAEALPYQQQAVEIYGYIGPQANELYTAILAKIDPEKSQMELERLIRKNVYTEDMKVQLKQLYENAKSSTKGFDRYLKGLENSARRLKQTALKKVVLDERAPEFSLVDRQGKAVSLTSLKGKVVFLDFWATWCGPCLASFPLMQKAVHKYAADPDVVFLFINTRENHPTFAERKDAVEALLQKMKVANFNVLYDEKDGETYKGLKAYKVEGIPTKVVIDKRGIIRFKMLGHSSNEIDTWHEIELMIKMAKSS